MTHRRPLAERFWAKVDIGGPGECWPWTGSTNDGYGAVRAICDGKYRVVKATRARWFLEYGEWPKMKMLHSCDNPPCVNLAHLSEGTDTDNKRQEVARGRNHNANKACCPRGHSYAEHARKHGTRRHCGECMRLYNLGISHMRALGMEMR